MNNQKLADVGQLTRLIHEVDRWINLRKERDLNANTLCECKQRLEEYRSIVVIHRHQQQQEQKVG